MAPIGYVTEKGKDGLWRIFGEERIKLTLKDSYTFALKPDQPISYDEAVQERGVDCASGWTTVIEPTYYRKYFRPPQKSGRHARLRR